MHTLSHVQDTLRFRAEGYAGYSGNHDLKAQRALDFAAAARTTSTAPRRLSKNRTRPSGLTGTVRKLAKNSLVVTRGEVKYTRGGYTERKTASVCEAVSR